MPQVKPVYLQHTIGKVVELHPAHKAIIGFTFEGESQRALLWTDKLMVNGQLPSTKEDVRDHLNIGSRIAFKCHALDATGKDNCSWFIVAAIRQELHDKEMDNTYFFGLVNASGTPAILNPRQGVLEYTSVNGENERVMFQASKIYLYGKRLGTKQRCDKQMQHDQEYNFDAIPINSRENEHGCSWFATAVWKGNRPDEARNYGITDDSPLELLTELRLLAGNPKGVFWCGYGHVWAVLNDDLALILGRVKPNLYETILMHRSFFSILKHRINDIGLTEIFKRGDRVQIVAVPATSKLMVQWVASHVSPDYDGSDVDSVNLMP